MAELKLYRLVLGMIGTNVYLIQNTETKEVIIVDPADSAPQIIENIDKIEGKPVAIFLTHGHYDHILAVNEIKAHYNIPVIAHEDEVLVLSDMRINMSGLYGLNVKVDVEVPVKDNEEITYAGLTCKVLHTPGHTQGSCCYYFEEAKILISGDTLFQFSFGRTDFATSSHKAMENSIRRLLTELPADVTACPGHMSFTTIDAERKYNPLA